MRIWSIAIILSCIALLFACGERREATPLETFKTYTKAIKKKDADTMKLLLSEETVKKHEDEAAALKVPLEEILLRDTLFNPNQKSVEYRDEKIEGDKATLQVKNSSSSWITLQFVREDGVWKIDKAGVADIIIKDILNRQKQALDNEIPVTTLEPELEPQE